LLKCFRVKTHGNFAFVYIYVVLIVFKDLDADLHLPERLPFFAE